MVMRSTQPIWLLEGGGERREFDPVELQDVLVRCFLGAGLRENCYLAEDIALAVEYAFGRGGRPEKIYSRAELDSAVVRILGDTGLADVASLYRRGARGALTVDCRTDAATVCAVLRKFVAGSPEHLDFLSGKVAAAAAALRIESAAPSLLVELARYYETALPPPAVAPPVPAVAADAFFALPAAAVEEVLPAEAGELLRCGVLRIHGVSRLFPSVRMFCYLSRLAAMAGWVPPVTEMTLAPHLYDLGRMMERCRGAVQQAFADRFGGEAALPVYLSLPDMGDFAERYLEASRGKAGELEQELAQMLLEGLTVRVEKLQIS